MLRHKQIVGQHILRKTKDHFLGCAKNYKSVRKINGPLEIRTKNTNRQFSKEEIKRSTET